MSLPQHIVAVAGLVRNVQGQVLMILSPRGDWEFPGGQVEQGENLIDALQREIKEETGIDVTVGALAGVYSNVQSHIVMLDFICTPLSQTLKTSAESVKVEWVDPAAAPQRIARRVIRDRLQTMLDFDGQITYRVTYRAYSFDSGSITTDYNIELERKI